MRFQEIQERCWTGYRQAGMKRKGDRQVPNCVPVEEVKTGPEMTLNDLLYTAAARAMHQAGLEGVPMDYEEAIKKAAKIYRIPYTPSELPRLLAQRAEIDRKLDMLKQGKQVAKARRKEKLAPTPAGAEEYWRTHALPTDRIKPPASTLEEYTGDPSVDNAARELLGMVLMFGVPFAVGTYINIRNKLRKYQGKQIIDTLERKGVTMNRQTYEKVKPVLDRFDQAIRDNEGAEARALAKQIEQMIIMGKLSAAEPKAPNSALAAKEKELAEDLRKWFKDKWVRFGPDGKIRGDCARGSESEGKPKCLPQAKAHALGKKGRASAAAKKRREDPNPERRGPARNVATKVREQGVAEGKKDDSDMEIHQKNAARFGRNLGLPDRSPKKPNKETDMDQHRKNVARFGKNVKEQHDWDDADEFGMPGSEFFPAKQPRGHYKVYYMTATDHKLMGRYATRDEAEQRVRELKVEYPDNQFIVFASQRGMKEQQELDEKQDACYRKVKSRYKVWPSAYASGALVQCRKKGAANWGTGGKKK